MHMALLLGGICVSLFFFLAVLIGKGTIKSKCQWTLIVLFAVVLQWQTEPFLIKASYLIYLKSNAVELAEANSILEVKTGEISVINDKIVDKTDQLSEMEISRLIELRKDLDVYLILKSKESIYYGLWGFLDVRLGVVYWLQDTEPKQALKSLRGNWYY